jgi:PEP-CTERM motif
MLKEALRPGTAARGWGWAMRNAFRYAMVASVAVAGAVVSSSMSTAQAGVVWSEDWNPSNFATSGVVVDGSVGDVTDRAGWLNVTYNVLSSATEHGWTFGGSDFLVINTTTSSPSRGGGALYLNECCNPGVTGGGGATAATTITGLTAGKTYDVSFTYWGDNRPYDGSPGYPSYPGYYDLFVTLGGGPQMTYPGVDQYPGSSSGYNVSIWFTATGSTESLSLAQFSSDGYQQSPIVGSITVSVPEPSTWAMMALGFASLGLLGYRKRSTALAAE